MRFNVYATRFDCGYAVCRRICRLYPSPGNFTPTALPAPATARCRAPIHLVYLLHATRSISFSTLRQFSSTWFIIIMRVRCGCFAFAIGIRSFPWRASAHTHIITLATLFLYDLIIFRRCWLHFFRCTFLPRAWCPCIATWWEKAAIIICRELRTIIKVQSNSNGQGKKLSQRHKKWDGEESITKLLQLKLCNLFVWVKFLRESLLTCCACASSNHYRCSTVFFSSHRRKADQLSSPHRQVKKDRYADYVIENICVSSSFCIMIMVRVFFRPIPRLSESI